MRSADSRSLKQIHFKIPILGTRCRSVQKFTDNAVNPCVDSTYIFIDHVISHLKQMHSGIQPLSVYHVGGDEVAKGAWALSPACQHLRQQLSKSARRSTADLKTYFIQRSSHFHHSANKMLHVICFFSIFCIFVVNKTAGTNGQLCLLMGY